MIQLHKHPFISYTAGIFTALSLLTTPTYANEDSGSLSIPVETGTDFNSQDSTQLSGSSLEENNLVQTLNSEDDSTTSILPNGPTQDDSTHSAVEEGQKPSLVEGSTVPTLDSSASQDLTSRTDLNINLPSEENSSSKESQISEDLETSTTENDITFPSSQIFSVDQNNKKVMYSLNVNNVTQDLYVNFTWSSIEGGPQMDTKTPVVTVNNVRVNNSTLEIQSVDNTISGDVSIRFPLSAVKKLMTDNKKSESNWAINIAYQAIPSNDPQKTQLTVQTDAYSQPSTSSQAGLIDDELNEDALSNNELSEITSFEEFEDDFTTEPGEIDSIQPSDSTLEDSFKEQIERAGTSTSPVSKQETITINVNQVISGQLNTTDKTYTAAVQFTDLKPAEMDMLVKSSPDIFFKDKVKVTMDGQELADADYTVTDNETSATNTYKIALSDSGLSKMNSNSKIEAIFDIISANYPSLETSTEVDNGVYATTYTFNETGVAKPFSASHHYDKDKQTWTVSLVLNQKPASMVLTFTQQQGSVLNSPSSITLDGAAVSPSVKKDGTTYTLTFSASDVAKMKESSKIEVVFPVTSTSEVTEKVVMNVNDGNTNKDFSATFRVVKSSSTSSTSSSTSSSKSSSTSSKSSSSSSSASTVKTSTQTGTYALIGVLAAAAAAFVVFAVLSRKSKKSEK